MQGLRNRQSQDDGAESGVRPRRALVVQHGRALSRVSNMADPGFPLNCPKCGTRLVYLRTQDDTHFYRCAQRGLMVLPPHGRGSVAPAVCLGYRLDPAVCLDYRPGTAALTRTQHGYA